MFPGAAGQAGYIHWRGGAGNADVLTVAGLAGWAITGGRLAAAGALGLAGGLLALLGLSGSSTEPVNNEQASSDDDREIETGNADLDGVLDGSTPTDEGNKGFETPQTQEEFEDNIRNIPGAEVNTHSGGGIHATLSDGTQVSTYPERASTGEPGWQVTSPEGEVTHKGSLVGND